MTDEEIADFIKDSVATLRILTDKKSMRLESVQSNFHADLAYLQSLGRITPDDYNDLTQPDNLRF